VIVNITGGPDLSLAEAADATALITKVADPEANVIYGIVTDESMGEAVKVTVIATGFTRSTRRGANTPVDLGNYVGGGAAAGSAASQPTGESGGFYRKTPQPKAAAGGGGAAPRLDLDVPAFLRKQGGGSAGGGGESGG
jgi:cell division protein FtsZ